MWKLRSLSPCTSFFWLILSYVLLQQAGDLLSGTFPWVLGAVLAHWWNPGSSLWDPMTSSGSKTQVTTWTCEWRLEKGVGTLGRSCGTDPSICGTWHHLQGDSIRIELNCRTASSMCRKLTRLASEVKWYCRVLRVEKKTWKSFPFALFFFFFPTLIYTLNSRDFSASSFRSDGCGEQTFTSVYFSVWNAWNKRLVILHVIKSQHFLWRITASQKTFL